MGPRLTLHGLVWAALAVAACSSDDDPTNTANNTVAAGASGQAAGGAVATGGAGYAGVPQLGFAGFGRDAMGMCPNPPGMTCTGSVMDYTMCLSVQCAAAYTDCYGTNGYCLSTMWCDNGCPCGDQACLQTCYPKDCNSCLERLNQCAATTTCVPMTCTMGGAAGAPGLGGAGGSAGAPGLSDPAAGAGGSVGEFAGAAGSR
jgi:hypothetical protein